MDKTTTMAVEQLSYREMRTYVLALAFVAGNIVLPQLCHLVPGGGLRWLPIYFFTLIAAYRYGMATGMATALLSPIMNHLLFGMPPAPMLPIILVKSTLLAAAASMIARRVGRATLWSVVLAVIAYQGAGMLVEWAMTASLAAAMQDVAVGWPGIVAQMFGGWAVVRLLA